MYDDPSQFEPLLIPESRPPYRELIGLAHELSEASASFAASVSPQVGRALADLVAGMNCYYSNLIEGHKTLPLDIHRAMERPVDDSAERKKTLAEAHIQVDRWAREQVISAETVSQFLCETHRRFCELLPEEMLILEDGSRMVPGEIRTREVQVGQHIPPAAASLAQFLTRFSTVYGRVLAVASRGGIAKLESIVASVLAHHRLAWVHPFLDGNGRVARIVLDAMLRQTGVKGIGLWSLSRGFAKTDARYKEALAGADWPRMGDLDGRGNLSESKLAVFGQYVMETGIDQVNFMSGLFALDALEDRAMRYFQRVRTDLKPEAALLYVHALRHGEFERMEAERITRRPERTARVILGELLKERLLVSDTPRGRLRPGFPVHALASLFPNLYPLGDLDTGSRP